jgi:hypothetical protein
MADSGYGEYQYTYNIVDLITKVVLEFKMARKVTAK